jgi:hypothetical protein
MAPKLIFVDFLGRFQVPSRDYVPAALAASGNFVFYGPGYVDDKTLKAGFKKFAEDQGASVVVVTEHIAFAEINFQHQRAWQAYRRYISNASRAHIELLPIISREIFEASLIKVLCMFESDFYSMSPDRVAVARKYDAIVGFGHQFIRPLSELPDWPNETFGPLCQDNVALLFDSIKSKVACLPHFVADSEFSWSPLAGRRFDWCVAGISYFYRARAAKALESIGFQEGRSMIGRVLLNFRLPNSVKEVGLSIYQGSFRKMLRTSKYAYTCGSALQYPLRKFFEIPSAGAVLVCKPFSGFAAAGFKHGENCVVCEPEDVMEAHRWLESDPDRAQRIADAGRTLVLRQHSVTARARQFAETFAAIADGSFAGGEWIDGEYVVHRKSASAHSFQGQTS